MDREQNAESLPDGAQSDATGPQNPGEDTDAGGAAAQPEKTEPEG
jgi:hypothetical protein